MSSSAPRKIIIDTDPGQDDAVAILLALASPEFEVMGVVTVAGNVPLHRTALNARRVVELAGRPDVPVFAGCPRPMLRTLVTAEHVARADGARRAAFPRSRPSLAVRPRRGLARRDAVGRRAALDHPVCARPHDQRRHGARQGA